MQSAIGAHSPQDGAADCRYCLRLRWAATILVPRSTGSRILSSATRLIREVRSARTRETAAGGDHRLRSFEKPSIVPSCLDQLVAGEPIGDLECGSLRRIGAVDGVLTEGASK